MLHAGADQDESSTDRQGRSSTPIRLLSRRKRYCTYDSPQAAAANTPDPWPEYSRIVDQFRVVAGQLPEEAQLHNATMYTAPPSVVEDMLDEAQNMSKTAEEEAGSQGGSPDGDADFGRWSRERSLPDSAPPVYSDDPIYHLSSQRSPSRVDSAKAVPISPVHRSSSPYSLYRRACMGALPSSPNCRSSSRYGRSRDRSPGALAVSPLYWYLRSTRDAPHSPATPGAAPNSPDTCSAAPSPRGCDPSASALRVHLPHIKVPRSSAEDWSVRHSMNLGDDITRPSLSPFSPSRRSSPVATWRSPAQVAVVPLQGCCSKQM